ncbi:hypothetical protein, partial [Longimicrobium sp.]|uniref:hypothetical protein n=1 Tax=Longimicrobium sp. TaxID=2029185 RepID=UPI002F921285
MAGETNLDACVCPALQRALSFMDQVQLESGEFPSSWYRDAGLSGQGVLDASPFVTTFALYALSWLRDDAAARPLADRAAAFLLRERRSGGLWGYTAASNRFPVEPDLD